MYVRTESEKQNTPVETNEYQQSNWHRFSQFINPIFIFSQESFFDVKVNI